MQTVKPDNEINKIYQENVLATTPASASSKLNVKIQYYVIYYLKKFVNLITNKKTK